MEFLKELGIGAHNPGAYFGNGEWSTTQDQGIIESINPATGEKIAAIYGASAEDYERVINTAQQVFEEWRTIPAPRRGEAVRLCTEALRKNKDALGSLVAMEMGKIKAEGDGEVQEIGGGFLVIASGTGMPVSTTHTLVGAVLGVGMARGIEAIDLKIVVRIFVSWVVTIPAGAILAILFFFLFKAVLPAG